MRTPTLSRRTFYAPVVQRSSELKHGFVKVRLAAGRSRSASVTALGRSEPAPAPVFQWQALPVAMMFGIVC